MGILDGIVEWIAKQVMNVLDLITTSVLGALGCNMDTFLRYFPAAETMYKIFVATSIGLILLNWVWQLFKNFGLIAGVEAEDPVKLSIRSCLFIGLVYFCDQITDIVLTIGGTPYNWIASFMNGGLAGAVGRQFAQSAINSVTGQGGNPISQRMFESSMQRGGSFANDVTGAVAKGNLSHTGSMKDPQAAQALSSYIGQTGQPSAPVYSNVEIGGGRIPGMETSSDHPDGITFGMYQTDQYMTPNGNYETITAEDHSTWYKQYAADFVERTPYMTEKGKIAYREELVQKMPEMPRRKERV